MCRRFEIPEPARRSYLASLLLLQAFVFIGPRLASLMVSLTLIIAVPLAYFFIQEWC